MIAKMWDTSGRRLTAVCALLLLGSMAAMDVAHFHYHMAEAVAHADGDDDHRYDDRDCALFHSVPPAEPAFVVPIPEAPAAYLLLSGIQHHADGPPLTHNGPCAPPDYS